MSDAFWGVLVGGLIGVAGSLYTIWIQHKQWKTNRRIEYLQNKKERSLKDFQIFLRKLEDAPEIGYADVEFGINIQTPPEVHDEILRWVADQDFDDIDNEDDMRKYQKVVIKNMGNYLNKLDEEIDELTK